MQVNWLIELGTINQPAKARLICFPFAGGGISNFARWRPLLQDNISLHAFNLPGRERFFKEPFIQDYRQCLDTVYQNILPLTDLPLIFYGHSFGALTAYFTILELLKNHQPSPIHLVLSARKPPQLGLKNPISALASEAFLQELIERYNGMPEVILNNKDMLAMYLPIIQNDFVMYEQFPEVFASYSAQQITCDITTVSYKQDPSTKEEVARWQELTTAACHQYHFEGGHFQILNDPGPVVQIINTSLKL